MCEEGNRTPRARNKKSDEIIVSRRSVSRAPFLALVVYSPHRKRNLPLKCSASPEKKEKEGSEKGETNGSPATAQSYPINFLLGLGSFRFLSPFVFHFSRKYIYTRRTTAATRNSLNVISATSFTRAPVLVASRRRRGRTREGVDNIFSLFFSPAPREN